MSRPDREHAEQLLGEVGVDTCLDRALAPGGDDIAHAGRLDDGRVGALLDRGHLAADREAFGDYRDERSIELIDSCSQPSKIGCCRL